MTLVEVKYPFHGQKALLGVAKTTSCRIQFEVVAEALTWSIAEIDTGFSARTREGGNFKFVRTEVGAVKRRKGG